MEKAVFLCSPDEYATTRKYSIDELRNICLEFLAECGETDEELEEAKESLGEVFARWWDERNECGDPKWNVTLGESSVSFDGSRYREQ
jgi:hypothetical protein